jgi:hypothetical protein
MACGQRNIFQPDGVRKFNTSAATLFHVLAIASGREF